MTNCIEALEHYNKKHFDSLIIGGYAKVILKDSEYYGKVGLIVDKDESELTELCGVTLEFGEKWVDFHPNCVEPCSKPKLRGFEQISSIKTEIPMPMRKTKASAGYDIGVIHPLVFKMIQNGYTVEQAWDKVPKVNGCAIVTKPIESASIILPTGIKAYMQDNEVLVMAVRSSSGIKKAIRQANPPSWIDADYYNNPDNEGHIMFAISNDMIYFDAPIMNIAQGIFINYLVADTGNSVYERIGGIGSTGQ